MKKEIRLYNKLTTEDISKEEYIERLEKKFTEDKYSNLSDKEKRELKKKLLQDRIKAMTENEV